MILSAAALYRFSYNLIMELSAKDPMEHLHITVIFIVFSECLDTCFTSVMIVLYFINNSAMGEFSGRKIVLSPVMDVFSISSALLNS